MKYLITGGAGFIGSNFIKYMLNKYPNDKFICLDALTYASSLESLEDIKDNPNFEFVLGNICDEFFIDYLFEKEQFDYVVNFAAESHVDRSFIYPKLFNKTNVEGVLVLLEASRKYNVKRFHQISTDEVYGTLSLDSKKSFDETSELKPTTVYSKTKAMADELVLKYNKVYNMNVTISRSTNNYGIYQHPEKLIPRVVKMALSGEEITVYGNGLNIRDWLYVLDHCRAIDLVLHKGRSGEIYNIGASNELANIYMINKILKHLNLDNVTLTYTNFRPNDDIRYSLNCDKIKKELGWNLKSDFDSSLLDVINWYKENLDWIERILSK